MEAPVEIRYSGVILGRVGEMPNAGEAAPFFLPMREPLPVGTVLRLRLEDRETPVRVVHTVESPDPDVAGMQVRTIGESEVVAFEFIPAPVPMLDTPKSESATSAVEPTTPRRMTSMSPPVPESGIALGLGPVSNVLHETVSDHRGRRIDEAMPARDPAVCGQQEAMLTITRIDQVGRAVTIRSIAQRKMLPC